MSNAGHRSRTRTIRTLTATAVTGALIVAPMSSADATQNLKPHHRFTMAANGSSGATTPGAGIPNIDSVKSTIRTYYKATAGIADKQSSPYISEMGSSRPSSLASLPTVAPSAKKAVVFDADDTTLWTYDMEDGAMHFNFDPVLQNQWVQDERFPATPGMVDFVAAVAAKGYTIFGLTGRNDGQKAATVANLSKVGYADFRPTGSSPNGPAPATASSRPTSPVPRRPAPPSNTRPAPASTSSRTSATTSRSTSATSGPTCRAASPTTRSSCRTLRTTCRARTSRAPLPATQR